MTGKLLYVRHTLISLLACAFVATSTMGASGPASVNDGRLAKADREPQNWLAIGGGRDEQHYSALDQINASNVAQLKPAWFAEYDTVRGQEGEPVVIDGVMYVTTAWSKVYAYDAATGRELWMFDPEVPGEAGVRGCCDVVNRGAAVYKGKVYVGTFDGRLIAIDARTGKQAWGVNTVDQTRMYSITGAPRIVRDKVIIGNGGAEYPVRGYVSAYDAASGKLVWRFYTVPGQPGAADGAASDRILAEKALSSWAGKWWEGGGGGTVWDAIVYDRELDRLYIGVGNGAPHNYLRRSNATGDNLFLSSIVALDPDTGKYIWHYQLNPGEAWDYTATQPIILADLTIDGAKRKVMMQAPKNGFFYVIDRTTGVPISARPFASGIRWASGIDPASWRPIETPNNRYLDAPFISSPGPAGAHNWSPMAFSPQTGLVYIPTSVNSWTYAATRAQSHEQPDPTKLGGLPKPEAYLQAFDPRTGKEVWRVDASEAARLDLGGSGVLATAGGLVFHGYGELVGQLLALDAATGKLLWRHRTPNAIMAAPVSYSVRGEQYIAVSTGAGGPLLFGGNTPARERQPGRMVVFKLGGKATLPAEPPLAGAANPPAEQFSLAAIEEGQRLYGRMCARCHGAAKRAHNIIPDLRRSAALTDRETWKAIVIDGALAPNGMIGWSKDINAAQAESIRGFIGAEALALQKEQHGQQAAH